MLDKDIHSNLVYYKHNGDDETYDYKNRNLLKYTNPGMYVVSFKKSGGLQADQSRIRGRK